jgi:hypothetical protein
MSGISAEKGRPYIEFIEKHLAKEDTISGGRQISETEKTLGEDAAVWFWLDDNGKALEVLTQSDYLGSEEIRSLANKMSKFIMSSAKPPLLFRRRLLPDLRIASKDETNTLLFSAGQTFNDNPNFTSIGVRYHDYRNGDAPCIFGKHKLKGVFHGKDGPSEIDAVLGQDTLSETSLKESDDGFVLTKTHIIKPNNDESSKLRVSIELEQRGSEPFVRLETSTTPIGGSAQDVTLDLRFRLPADYSVTQVNPGFVAMSQTSKPYRDSQSVFFRIEHQDTFSGAQEFRSHDLHRVYARPTQQLTQHRAGLAATEDGFLAMQHKLGDMEQDSTHQAALKLVVTGAHFHDHLDFYSETMSNLETSQELRGMDLSLSYDVGAEVNGVVSAYLADCHHAKLHGTTPEVCAPSTLKWIRQMTATYLDVWMRPDNSSLQADGSIDCSCIQKQNCNKGSNCRNFWGRGGALLLVSCDRMLNEEDAEKVGEHSLYNECVDRIGERLLVDDRGKWLDENGARALALLTAAKRSSSSDFAKRANEVAREVVNSWYIEDKQFADNDTERAGGIHSTNWENGFDNNYWGFKAGMVARTSKALLKVLAPEEKETCEHAVNLIKAARKYLHTCTVARDDGTREILTSQHSGETNSETQAWTILGLLDNE